jgi:peroxiredoxin
MPLEIGNKAPSFTLHTSINETISLSDFAGNKMVLILFFPQAFSSLCIKELCAIRDDISRYETANAQVLGISVDSVFTLAKFKEDQNLNFPLLSDFNKEVSTAYDCIHESFTGMNMKGVSKRSAFLVDKAGIIQYAEVSESPADFPNFEAINECITRLMN